MMEHIRLRILLVRLSNFLSEFILNYIEDVALQVSDYAEYLFEVCSFFKSFNVQRLLLIYMSSYTSEIKWNTFLFHHSKEFWVELADVFPVHLAHDESVGKGFGFVYYLRPAVVAAFEASENVWTLETYFEPYLAIDLVANVDLTLHGEGNFIYGLKLLKHNLSWQVSDGLQMLQKVRHKVLKFRVEKCPETFLLLRKMIFKGKVLSMPEKKATVQKVRKYSILNVFRHLIQYNQILWCQHGLICVIFPFVIKEILDLFFYLNLKVKIFVKEFDHSKKFTQVVSIIESLIDALYLVDDFYKVAHNIRENCYSKHEDHGNYQSFIVTTRIKVS